jgi:DNA polymerase V
MVAACGFTGFPSPAQDYVEKWMSLDQYLNVNENTTWFFMADGDSMTDVGISHGDVLVVDSTATPALGDICICIVEGEHMAKIVDMVKGRPALVSANKDYPPIFVDEVRIFGVVTGRVSKFRR